MKKESLNILNKLNSTELQEYLKNLPINNVLVFGSVLNDSFNEESDVDIAVLSKSKIPIKYILKLELFLEDLLSRPIDVIDLNSNNLDIFIKINILNTAESIYTSDNNIFLNKFIDDVDWYYKENEYYFSCRKRELLS